MNSDFIRVQDKIYKIVDHKTFELKYIQDVDPKDDPVMEQDLGEYTVTRVLNDDGETYHYHTTRNPTLVTYIGAAITAGMALTGIVLIIMAIITFLSI